MFDYGTAEALGIRLGNAGHRSDTVALMGAERYVQFEYVEMSLPGAGVNSWTADVAFIKQMDFQMPFQGILGQQGFLDHFDVTFRFYSGRFELRSAE